MKLSELTAKAPPLRVWRGDNDVSDPEILDLHYDSRRVGPGSLFFALEGEHSDGHDFVGQALAGGAAAVASRRPAPQPPPCPWVQAAEIRPYLALAAHEFFEQPSRELELIGVTGTNGKTTTTYLIHSILGLEEPSLLMGTVQTVVGAQRWDSERTTPEAADLQRILRRAVEAGCRRGTLEVSSHALAFHRAYLCAFPVAVFTNFSQDHLDFHGSMEAYFEAKSLLFSHGYNPALRVAVLNGDDAACARLPLPETVRVRRFSLQPGADAFPRRLEADLDGVRMEVELHGERLELASPLVGRHNAENVLAAVLACRQLGVPAQQLARGVSELAAVPGRFERVQLPVPLHVFVDYAHTPHALENVLRLCRQVAGGRVICVFGCGGDRDRSKRPLMGRVAAELADLSIVTSDNPRSEPPEAIVREIRDGMPAAADARSVVDRREAIALALHEAAEGDLVLIAGKGHETYQQIGGRTLPFDDRRVAREVA